MKNTGENITGYKKIDIDKVWAGHPVHFACERKGNNIFMSYYNTDRKLMVASYNTATSEIKKYVLPEKLGWDSHNGTSIGIDSLGFIHVSANIHRSPLIYYRSMLPLSIESFEKVNSMTGDNEDSCTYPVFFYKDDTLFFRYRSGRSGNGDTRINVYDTKTTSWSSALSTPLFDGESERNAYPSEFFSAKDGYFHLVWVWRETPDCETNHTPSYAKTKDFLTWYTASGDVIHLPIKNGEGDVIEKIEINSGLLNGCIKVGFDSLNHQIISYIHFDKEGNTQLYNARFEDNKWKIYQTSRWLYRWDFHGRGAIFLEIEVFPVAFVSGELIQHWKHKEYGEGFWVLNENLTIKEEKVLPDIYQEITKKSNEAFINKMCGTVDSGLFMTWETLPANRDKEREVSNNILLSSQLYLYIQTGK